MTPTKFKPGDKLRPSHDLYVPAPRVEVVEVKGSRVLVRYERWMSMGMARVYYELETKTEETP